MSDSAPWSHNLRPTVHDFSEDESSDSPDAPSSPSRFVPVSASEVLHPSVNRIDSQGAALPQQRETERVPRADLFHQEEEDITFTDNPFTIARRQAFFRRQRALTNGSLQTLQSPGQADASSAKHAQGPTSSTFPTLSQNDIEQRRQAKELRDADLSAVTDPVQPSVCQQITPRQIQTFSPGSFSPSSSVRASRTGGNSTTVKTPSNGTDTTQTQLFTSPPSDNALHVNPAWPSEAEHDERCSYPSERPPTSLKPAAPLRGPQQRKEYPALKPARLAVNRHEGNVGRAGQARLCFRPPTRDSHTFSAAVSPPSLASRQNSDTGSWVSGRSAADDFQRSGFHDSVTSQGSTGSWSPDSMNLQQRNLYSTPARFKDHQSPLPSFALPFSTTPVNDFLQTAGPSRLIHTPQKEGLITSPWFTSGGGNGLERQAPGTSQVHNVPASECITISDSEDDDNHSQVFAYDPHRENVPLVPNHFVPQSPQKPYMQPFSQLGNDMQRTGSWVVDELDRWRGRGTKRPAPVEDDEIYAASYMPDDYDRTTLSAPSQSTSQRLSSFSYSPTRSSQQPDDAATIRARKRQHVTRAVPSILEGLAPASSTRSRASTPAPGYRSRNAPSARGKAIALKRFRLPVLQSHRLSAPVPQGSSATATPLRQVDTNSYGMRRLKVPPGMQVQVETQQLGAAEGGGTRRLTLFKPSPLRAGQEESRFSGL